MKKNTLFFILVLALAFMFCSCNNKNVDTQVKTTETNASSVMASSDESDTTESVKSQSASDDKHWPAEFEGKLPKPECTITGVMRYDEKSMSGKLTIVNFSNMSKANAQKYVAQLEEMGFTGGMKISNDKNIIFNGIGKDKSAKNGVNFNYVISSQNGSISY